MNSTPRAPAPMSFSEFANFIWGVADLLRGDYKRDSSYGGRPSPNLLLLLHGKE